MKPKIIDLFSGCGGLALGFEKAGFEIAAGIELMQPACDTISYNLSWRYGKKENHICGDITQLEPDIFKNSFGDEGCIVIGGPPCQAYSMAGRGKLRSLGEERVNTNDSRGYLFKDFLRFIYGLDARAVVMENVPEATDFGGINVPELVCEQLINHGYKAHWTVLNSADYGVPQIRNRIFLFAIKENEGIDFSLPEPTNRNINEDIYVKSFKKFENYKHYRKPNYRDNLPKWVTVGDAFSDLPSLFKTKDSAFPKNDISKQILYKSAPVNNYQKLMRSWYGNESASVTGNVFRKTARDFPIFEKMKQGDDYIAASEIADELFRKEAVARNLDFTSHEYFELHKKMVPPYNREKFSGKWKRLSCDLPSHTVVAHLCKDTYGYIHPWEPRGITVREAARLQSFPDDFLFNCTIGDAYKQIGNAVPPLLAYGVAKVVYEQLGEEKK